MHETGMTAGRAFIETYWNSDKKKILDVGARDVNGSLRQFTPPGAEFVGLDIEEANGVDVVLAEPGADFPFMNDTFDLLVSTSCFEHDQMFWHTFTEMVRVCSPEGLSTSTPLRTGVTIRTPTTTGGSTRTARLPCWPGQGRWATTRCWSKA